MILASDLDQTLIFSENFFARNNLPFSDYRKDLQIIEYYEGGPLSYIDGQVLEALMETAKYDLFVPVTTRTVRQYRRIKFQKLGIDPQFAVTTNGAVVLEYGKRDLYWDRYIDSLYEIHALDVKAAFNVLSSTIPSGQLKIAKVAENRFSYAVIHKELFDDNLIKCLKEELGERWQVSYQGRKIYCMPFFLSKWGAVEYILKKKKMTLVLAAGDSLLDIPLLKGAAFGFVPGHGEISKRMGASETGLVQLKEKGVEAARVILKTYRDTLEAISNKPKQRVRPGI